MNITDSLEIKNTGLYHKDSKTFIFGDVHIGYEEAMNKQGYMVPRFQWKEIKKSFEEMIKTLDIETIIINGDLKHEFGNISDQEWRETLKFLDLCLQYSKKVILVKGNHDTIVEPILKKKNIEVVDKYVFDNITCTHGDTIPEIETDTIIISHEHPAITLREGNRNEIFKCFLKGLWKKQTLIVLPSFHQLYAGADLLKEQTFSPFFKEAKLDNFRVYIIDEKVYDFRLFKDIKKKLRKS